ncbi:MAG: serine/threonine-protein kinase [Myxococcaceae bacterium]
MSQLGKYTLVRKLATGGMAEVFLAKSVGPRGFEKSLVLKRILPHLAEDPIFVEMFLSEGRLAALLDHPNVVQIFEFGEVDGAYYIAMEYIDGPNLRALSRRAVEQKHRLPLALCAKIVATACDGLAYAHDFADPTTGKPLNLVHRDISSDNIMLSRSGSVKVVDFGIAKAANLTPHTRTGSLKGKLAYMPPEQFRRTDIDRRSDIFALGVVLYELIAGRKPFHVGSEVEVMQAILYEPPIPISSLRDGVPEALRDILDKALAKERDERYPDCRAFQHDLEQFIVSTGEPVSSFHLGNLVAELMGETTPWRTMTPSSQLMPFQDRPATPPPPARRRSELAPTTRTRPIPDRAPENAGEATVLASPTTSLADVPAFATVVGMQPATKVVRRRSKAPLVIAAAVAALAVIGVVAFPGAKNNASEDVPQKVAAGVPPVPAAPVEPVAERVPLPPAEPAPSPAEQPKPRAEPIPVPREEPRREVRKKPQPPKASLRLETTPRARIKLNGKFVGRSPLTLRNLEPGDVRVEAYDRELGFSKEERFRLEAGDNGTKRIVVEKVPVEFRVRPWAVVFLDGIKLGPTPFTTPQQAWEGKHKVTLVNPNLGKEVTLPFEVKPGQDNIFKHNLTWDSSE